MNKRLVIVAICLLLCLAYLLHKEASSTDSAKNGIAILKDKIHEVQTRRAKSMSWDDAKEGEQLQYYDSILTMESSQAEVTFNDGTNLKVGADSLVVLEPPIQKNSGMRLNLKHGTATLTLKKGEKLETKRQLIVANVDTTIQLSTDAKDVEETIKLAIETQKGRPPHQPSPIEVTPLIEANPSKSRKPAADNTKPLRAPKIKTNHLIFKIEVPYQHSQTSLFFENVLSFFMSQAFADDTQKEGQQLEWESVPGALSYEIEISRDKEFKDIIITKTTTSSFTNLKMAKPGSFFWHVRGIDQNGTPGEFSEIAIIDIIASSKGTHAPEVSLPQPPIPKLVHPHQTFILSSPTPSPTASAAQVMVDAKPNPSPMAPVEAKKNLFALEPRVFGSWGSMSDQQGYFPSVPTLTESAAVAVGAHLANWTPSLYGEYFISNQMSSTQSENVSGSGYFLGGELKYKKNKFSVAGSYLFFGKYQLNQQTAATWASTSQASTYDKPGGIELTFGWELNEKLSFIVTAKQVYYYEWNLGGSNINIANDTLSQISYGLGLSYELF